MGDRDDGPSRPDPEVEPKARRRSFSPAYKLRILTEYEAATEPGAKGAILRRENLYSAHLVEWRKARDAGALAGMSKPKGRPAVDDRDRELTKLRVEKERLEKELAKARFVIEVQGKVSELLEKLSEGMPGTTDDPNSPTRRNGIEDGLTCLTGQVGVSTAAACAALGRSRATHYRRHRKSPAPPRPAPIPHRARRQPAALSPAEREQLIEVLHSERFVDAAPAQVWATLLDEGVYLASQRTMYRLLAERGETGERRRQATHPAHVKPELVADKPNTVWSWDITKLRGPKKWSYFYLYVILDVYSRYVVGWMVADRESAALAEDLITASCEKQRIDRNRLTIHADRGTSMTSKTVALLLADLGVTRSHSRPRVSNDNPYSEAQFKTLKYRPDFPGSFDSIQTARSWCRTFFDHYNNDHRHSGIGLLTPAVVHHGQAPAVRRARAGVLDAAYAAHPERFVRPPTPPAMPEPAWINRPQNDGDQTEETETETG
ncbi:IS3 family transposase [Frankia sp. ACN1ag]|uniref:IS3 family transposase n=1 Tax=Frankia sp. ACN1ag TaxID=102891 RepID=UPI0037BE363A